MRPPYPAQSGLFGRPTLINNVETYANLPWIFRHGAAAFARHGTAEERRTGIALAGKTVRGGLIEVPMGITIRRVVEDIGGGIARGRRFKAVLIGGPSGGCLPESLIDTPIDYESLVEKGAIMGSGGLVVLDDGDCMVNIARYFLSFCQHESCGRCTFCSIGTRRMQDILQRLTEGGESAGDLEELQRLSGLVKSSSQCGLGKTAPNPVITTLRYFRGEYKAHLAGRCPAGVCKNLIRYEVQDNCTGCTFCAPALSRGGHRLVALREAPHRPGALHALRRLPAGLPGPCREGELTMPTIIINGRAVEVAPGATVLAAAGQIGIRIPTICFGGNGCLPSASCLVCAVKLSRTGQMVPSCAVQVTDGMEVESQTREVDEVRRAAVELLLSDHVGDCISLCQRSCPAHADIAAMLRQVRGGRFAEAIAVANGSWPCRRPWAAYAIGPASDHAAARRSTPPWPSASSSGAWRTRIWPPRPPTCRRKRRARAGAVAIVGGGPTGLSAAWHLLLRGHDCTLLDQRGTAGGSLFDEFPAELLPPEVVAAEVELIRRLGTRFELGGPHHRRRAAGTPVGRLRCGVVRVGLVSGADVAGLGLAADRNGIGVNRFLQTSRPRVLAAGQAVRRTSWPGSTRWPAGGPRRSTSTNSWPGPPWSARSAPFSSHVRCLRPEEMPQFLAGAIRRRAARQRDRADGLDPRASRARGRPMLPLRLPQGGHLPAPPGRRAARGPAQPLRRATAPRSKSASIIPS